MFSAAPASAHRTPGDCLANGLDLPLGESSVLVRQGDTMTFFVGVQNNNTLFGKPCDITNGRIGIRLPGPSGRYDPASVPTPVVTGGSFASGLAGTQVGKYEWVVKLDPQVTFGNVQATAAGTLHITDPDQDFAGVVKDVSFTVTNPSLSIDKTGSIVNGQAPQNVTYTYVVTNTSQTAVPMREVKVSDDLCSGPTYTSGDNGDSLLSNGEKWTFTCATLHQAAGTYTNTAKACAISNVDNREVCSPPDTWTVVLTPPPGNPPPPPAETGVKPANATQAPCTLSTPKGLKVRARELTSIKATVRQVDAGTAVKITLPGGKTVSAKTNSKGVAILKVRPPKTGTARITVAECSDVQRLTVRAARKTQSKRVPRVTG